VTQRSKSSVVNKRLHLNGGKRKLDTLLGFFIKSSLSKFEGVKYTREFFRFKKDDYNWKHIGVVRSKIVNDGTIRSIFANYFKFCEYRNYTWLSTVFAKMEPAVLNKVLSDLNTWAKKELSLVYPPKDWIKLCELSPLVGFPKNEERIFKQDIFLWLAKAVPDPQIPNDFIYDNMKMLFGFKIKDGGSLADVSFEEFLLTRWRWMNDGAAKDSILMINGEKIKTKKGLGLSVSNKRLLELASFDAIYKTGLRAFVKTDEKGLKGRFVVNAPFGLFVHLKYVMDKVFKDFPRMNSRLPTYNKEVDKILVIQRSMSQGVFHIPIDFSAFDSTIHLKFFDTFVKVIRSLYPNDYEVLKSINILARSLRVIPVYNEKGINVGRWMNGVPSGLYITSFINSVINVVCQLYVEKLSNGKYKSLFGSGDDGDLISTVTPNLLELKEYFGKTGLEINIEKNWFAPGLTEFLKMIITTNQVFQYPARAFASVCWAYPSNFNNITIYGKMFTIASVWKEFFDRMLIYDEELLINDLFNAIKGKLPKFGKKLIKDWLHIAPALGGFGLLPFVQNKRVIIKSQRKNLVAKNLINKRYPMVSDFIKDVKIISMEPKYHVNTRVTHSESIKNVMKTNHITFNMYVEYIRYLYSLTNNLVINLKVQAKADANMMFRIIGYSDDFVKEQFGTISFIGFTLNYYNWINDVVQLFNLKTLANRSMLVK